MYAYEHSDLTSSPINTAAQPLGSGTVNANGYFLQDPAWQTITSSGPFDRAKTIAACMQLEYIGARSAASGQVAIVRNVSLAQLNRAAGVGLELPSVNAMFSFAGHVSSVSDLGHEVIWEPTELECKLRDNTGHFAGTPHNVVPDSCFWQGSPGARIAHSTNPNPADACGIIIAWRGFDNNQAIAFRMTKVVELELAPTLGAIEQAKTTGAVHSNVGISEVTRHLRAANPNWNISSVIKSPEAQWAMGAAVRAFMPKVASAVTTSVAALMPSTSRYPAIMDGEL